MGSLCDHGIIPRAQALPAAGLRNYGIASASVNSILTIAQQRRVNRTRTTHETLHFQAIGPEEMDLLNHGATTKPPPDNPTRAPADSRNFPNCGNPSNSVSFPQNHTALPHSLILDVCLWKRGLQLRHRFLADGGVGQNQFAKLGQLGQPRYPFIGNGGLA
jgi:hypothetical protein